MTLVTFNRNPTTRQLRQFGVLCAVALPCFAWLWSLNDYWLGGLAAVGFCMATLAWWMPHALAPVFIGFMLAALPIGILLSEIVLILIYFGIFLPIGLIFRCMGRDRLQRRIDRDCESYWQEKAQPRSVASYYRQS